MSSEKYFVIAADGQKYGPADLATLASWAQEGRIEPETVLESVSDGVSLLASQVPGLLEPLPAEPAAEATSPEPEAEVPSLSPTEPAQVSEPPAAEEAAPAEAVSQPEPELPALSPTEPAQVAEEPAPTEATAETAGPQPEVSAEKFFVFGVDGNKYGPADVPTLAAWAREGRLDANTVLESVSDMTRRSAVSVPGIINAQSNPYAQPMQPVFYPRATSPKASNDLTLAWVFAAIGLASLLTCGCASGCLSIPFGVTGIVFSMRAQKNGERATGPLVMSVIASALSLLLFLFMMLGNSMSNWWLRP